MQRRFGKDDTEWLWEGKKPKSIIGLLRRHGLVLVGTQRRGTRNYKVVAIARDVLEAMQSFRCL